MRPSTPRRLPRALALLAAAVMALMAVISIPSRTFAADLPPRPPVTQEPAEPVPGVISVVVLPQPNLTAAPGSLVSFTIEAVNRGRGTARNLSITIPFNPAVAAIVDVTPSNPAFWVSDIGPDYLVMSADRVNRGQTLTAQLRMSVKAGAVTGESLVGAAYFTWGDSAGGAESFSNFPTVSAGTANSSTANFNLPLENSPNGFYFYSDLFAANEPVGIWYNTPDGRAIDLGTIKANASGVIDMELIIGDDPVGEYSLVVYGLWTRITAVGPYRIVP